MHEDLQCSAIGEIHHLLGRLDLPYWLFGGWAVDFHAGRCTREHSDIDIVVQRPDLDPVLLALGRLGWVVSLVSDEDGYLQLDLGSLRLELTYVERDEDSGEVFTPLARGRGSWVPGALGDDVAELDSVRAHVVSLDSLVADKSEPRVDRVAEAKDRADLIVLRQLG